MAFLVLFFSSFLLSLLGIELQTCTILPFWYVNLQIGKRKIELV